MMLLIIIFAGSLGLNMFAFMTKSPFLYIMASLAQAGVCGALKLYLFEFMTEIIFPVSPVFALAILNSLSGLLSLLVQMFSDDVIYKNPNDTGFQYLIQILCLAICGISLFVFATQPYKLNRTDYDMCRRSTMVTSYMKAGPRKSASNDESVKNMYANMNGGSHDQFASSINSLLDEQARRED